MKKSLFLLPLLASLALVGCGKDKGGNNGGNGGNGGNNSGDNGGGGTPAEFGGLTLDYDAFSSLAEESGYQNGSMDVDGYEVSYSNLIVKEYIDSAYQSGDTEKSDVMFPVLQWKKDGSKFEISEINPKKLTFTYITTYAVKNIASVKFGGKTISGSKSGSEQKVGTLTKFTAKTSETKTFDIMRATYVFNINAEDLDTLEIANSTSNAQYVESIVLE